eukprot:PhF_6_TR19930/c0_g1_i2/m.28997
METSFFREKTCLIKCFVLLRSSGPHPTDSIPMKRSGVSLKNYRNGIPWVLRMLSQRYRGCNNSMTAQGRSARPWICWKNCWCGIRMCVLTRERLLLIPILLLCNIDTERSEMAKIFEK